MDDYAPLPDERHGLNDQRAARPTTAPQTHYPGTAGPESVPGAAEVIAEGFRPIEQLTGIYWVLSVWPDEHKRALTESRADSASEDGLLWFIRSPWRGVSPEDALTVVWNNLPRDQEPNWPAIAAGVLAWTQSRVERELAKDLTRAKD